MDKTVTYTTRTYSAVQAFLFCFPAFILLIVVLIAVARYTNSDILLIAGSILLFTVPFLFQKKVKLLFTRNIQLQFDECFLSSEIHSLTGHLVKRTVLKWEDIQFYKVYFTPSGMTYLTVYLKQGPSKTFSLTENSERDKLLDEKTGFGIFFYFVKQYNHTVKANRRITLKKSFLTTRIGTFVLYFLTIVTISLNILYFLSPKPRPFPVFFVGFVLVAGLLAQRESNKKLYAKLSAAETGLPVVKS